MVRESVQNPYRMCSESVSNVLGYCGLSERTIRRAVCQPTGHKNLRIHTFFQSSSDMIFQSRILIILKESSRDTHTYYKVQSRLSSSFNTLISFEKTESSRECHIIIYIQSRCVHTRTYLTHLDYVCYHMYIHFEIHHAQVCVHGHVGH